MFLIMHISILMKQTYTHIYIYLFTFETILDFYICLRHMNVYDSICLFTILDVDILQN